MGLISRKLSRFLLMFSTGFTALWLRLVLLHFTASHAMLLNLTGVPTYIFKSSDHVLLFGTLILYLTFSIFAAIL